MEVREGRIGDGSEREEGGVGSDHDGITLNTNSTAFFHLHALL